MAGQYPGSSFVRMVCALTVVWLAAARFQEVTTRYPHPQTLWDLSNARVYMSVGDVPDGVASLRRAVDADRTCARYISETPAFAPYRTNPLVAAVLTQR